MEEACHHKLLRKMEREQHQTIYKQYTETDLQMNANKTPITVIPCKHQPPFWWKHDLPESGERLKIDDETLEVMPQPDKSEYKASFLRWQEEPNIFDQNLTDPCKRRAEMALYVNCLWFV